MEALIERVTEIVECLRVGRQQLLQGRLHDPDSVSRELYDGAWQEFDAGLCLLAAGCWVLGVGRAAAFRLALHRLQCGPR